MSAVEHEIRSRSAASRWWVHLGLILTVAASLFFEPELSLHILLGLAFVVLVGAHLAQRRRVSGALVNRLTRPTTWRRAAGRLALADALLTALTMIMLGSGLWDWLAAHPTTLRWHAISGVVLTGLLLLHTVRRRTRLRSSRVR